MRAARIELADALTWLALRGLIAVLLFLSAKEVMDLPAYVSGAVMLVVLISTGLTAVGRITVQIIDRDATLKRQP